MIDKQVLDALSVFGDVEQQINSAVEEYLMRRIIERIKLAREHLIEFERQYRMAFADFSTQIVLDESFSRTVREQHPTWEQDLLAWEYWNKESAEWKNKLDTILSKS